MQRSSALALVASIVTLALPCPASAQKLEVAVNLVSTEGPAVDLEGNIYFSDFVNERIIKLTPAGAASVYREHSNFSSGLVVDPQDRLVAVEGTTFGRTLSTAKPQPRVTRTDLKTGTVEVLADNYRGQPFVSPNDVTIDAKGRLYFTDLAGHSVYRIDGPGQITRILGQPDIERPNGIQISPDDGTLYLIDTALPPGSPRLIRAYDLHADGSVSNMHVFYSFTPGMTGDGMSVDVRGNVYGTSGFNGIRGQGDPLEGKAGVYMLSPKGELLKFIPIPEDLLTNCTFGGPDMQTLFVTAGKTLFKFRTEFPGLPR